MASSPRGALKGGETAQARRSELELELGPQGAGFADVDEEGSGRGRLQAYPLQPISTS